MLWKIPHFRGLRAISNELRRAAEVLLAFRSLCYAAGGLNFTIGVLFSKTLVPE